VLACLLSLSGGCTRGLADGLDAGAGGSDDGILLRSEPKSAARPTPEPEPRPARWASDEPVLEPEPPPPFVPRDCREDSTDYGDPDLLCTADCDPVVDLDDGGVNWEQWRREAEIERVSRACFCAVTDCPPLAVSAVDALSVRCGCGKIEVRHVHVLNTRHYVYDQETLELVGGHAGTDHFGWYCDSGLLLWNESSLDDCEDYAECDPEDFVELCPAQQ
jgi:hypothetical protein